MERGSVKYSGRVYHYNLDISARSCLNDGICPHLRGSVIENVDRNGKDITPIGDQEKDKENPIDVR